VVRVVIELSCSDTWEGDVNVWDPEVCGGGAGMPEGATHIACGYLGSMGKDGYWCTHTGMKAISRAYLTVREIERPQALLSPELSDAIRLVLDTGARDIYYESPSGAEDSATEGVAAHKDALDALCDIVQGKLKAEKFILVTTLLNAGDVYPAGVRIALYEAPESLDAMDRDAVGQWLAVQITDEMGLDTDEDHVTSLSKQLDQIDENARMIVGVRRACDLSDVAEYDFVADCGE
jgi:hypothetical protein